MESELTTAQEKHRWVQFTLKGQPCGPPAVAGCDRCYRALNDGRCSIDVPLLEDEHSILFVYSQVARALAQGSMPAVNASGIVRCCRGAQRLLEEKRKRERAEEEKRAQHRAHGSADDAPHPKPGQTDAAVPPNSDKCEETGCPMSPVVGDMGSGCPIVCCERSADGAKSNGSAATGDMNASASADEPQPWNLERRSPFCRFRSLPMAGRSSSAPWNG